MEFFWDDLKQGCDAIFSDKTKYIMRLKDKRGIMYRVISHDYKLFLSYYDKFSLVSVFRI